MKTRVLTVLLALGGLSFWVLPGCDETIHKEEKVKVKDNGTVVHDKTETKREPDGTIVKEEKHEVSKP